MSVSVIICSEMQKNILYYKFVPVADPNLTRLWQRELCTRLGLKGRIIVSPHGINGTLCGDIEQCREYKREMNRSVTFKGIHYKWSDAVDNMYPGLSVKVKDEIVNFGAADELVVDEKGVVNGGKHLKPKQLHELVKKYGDDVVFFDGRNAYEAEVGKFKNAVTPNVRTSRDFIAEIERPEYEELKDKPVVTYCTGGIRCEILSALMKNRGFKDVYQLDGGIVTYGQTYGDEGLWEGKLYVFDGRVVDGFSDEALDVGTCVHCNDKTSRYVNCANKLCNDQVLVCESCADKTTLCAKLDCASVFADDLK